MTTRLCFSRFLDLATNLICSTFIATFRAAGTTLISYRDALRLAAGSPSRRVRTFRSAAPWLRLDYIFASPEMAARLRACDIVIGEEAERASDHFPIWAEFQ